MLSFPWPQLKAAFSLLNDICSVKKTFFCMGINKAEESAINTES
jgi:hypothetical protein